MASGLRRVLALFVSLPLIAALAACATQQKASEPEESMLPAELAGTTWQLVEFQSMDDSLGTTRPDDPTKYTMTLGADGRVSMELNCNLATGSWTAQAASAESGSFAFGPLAMTRAYCPPPSMDEQIGRDSEYVRSYLLRDGVLALSLFADGGIYLWEPAP